MLRWTTVIREDSIRLMNKSSFGTHFTVTTWGESHGKALGAARQDFLSVKKTSKNFSTDANPVRAATQLHVKRAILSKSFPAFLREKLPVPQFH